MKHALVPAVMLVGVLSILAAQQPAPVAYEVPVGGIILWWGRWQDIPYGFEACDGTLVSTKDAVLTGTKPNFESKFPRGAPNYRNFVPTAYAGGGSDTIALTAENVSIAPHTVKSSELPKHKHGMDHLHEVPDHTHYGLTTTLQGVDPNNNSTTQVVKSIATDPAQYDPANGTNVGLVTKATKPVDLAWPLLTRGSKTISSPHSPRPSTDDNATTTSGNLSLPHQVTTLTSKPADNRPAFVDIVFLIRVK